MWAQNIIEASGIWKVFFLILKTAKKNSYQAFFYKLPVLAHSDFMK